MAAVAVEHSREKGPEVGGWISALHVGTLSWLSSLSCSDLTLPQHHQKWPKHQRN